MTTVAYDHQIFAIQPVGGISRYFCELGSRIQRAPGWRARIVAPLHFNEHLAASTVPCWGLHLRMRVPRTTRLYRAANALLAPPLLASIGADVVHRTYYSAAPRPRRGRVVLTVFDMIHELYPKQFSDGDLVRAHKRRSVEAADHVICISRSTAADLMRMLDVPAHKISVTALACSPAFVAQQAHAPPSTATRPYLLYVGQRNGYKNFEALLGAWAGSSRLRADFDLVAFGGGALSPVERGLIDALPWLRQGSVRQVTGSDTQLAAAYRHAHAFVCPSLYEGFGIPPLEAMSCGCPVVSSDASSLPEVVGAASVTFDPASEASMREAIESVCYDDTRRRGLVAAGHAQAARFSWQRCADETLQAYRKVLG